MLLPSTPVITSIGMCSPLGTALTACAAARAGLNRIKEFGEEFSSFDEETGELVPLSGSIVEGVTNGFEGLGRLVQMGEIALADMAQNVSDIDLSSIPVVLCLSNDFYWREYYKQDMEPVADELPFNYEDVIGEKIKERIHERETHLLSRISKLANITLNMEDSFVATGLQANFPVLLNVIRDHFEKGDQTSYIVGAMDSLPDPRTLEILQELNMLQTAEDPIGIIPGECATFMLVERYDRAKSRGANILCAVESTGECVDNFNRFSVEPLNGQKLAQTILDVAQTGKGEKSIIVEMIGNLNGDIWRAKEWGAVLTHLPEQIRETPQWYPAAYFGETGAATGALYLALASHLLQRKYSINDAILLWLSGDDGQKGSMRVTKI